MDGNHKPKVTKSKDKMEEKNVLNEKEKYEEKTNKDSK